jgi:glycosyltransferase involved in cell wall biosynthesis
MNVIVVNDFAYVNGGASKIALGSAIELARSGNRVILFAAVGPVAAEFLNVDGLQVICLEQNEIVDNPNRAQAVVQGFWNSTAKARMQDLLAGLDSSQTIIHVHMWTKALSASVIQAANALCFRIILTLHDYFVACPAGTFFNHPQQAICHLRPMSASCIASNCDSRNYGHKLWRVGRQFVQHQFGMLPSGVQDYISISDLSEEVLKPFLPPQSRIHRVTNFIDLKQMPAADVESNLLFTFSGRLSPEKGAMLFAECSLSLGMPTLFIGDGPLRKQIEQLAPQASCTGWISPTEAAAGLRKSRALVFPSLWYETQGLVVAEAAAMGIPAIVPDTSATREWVENGTTGLWFRGGDARDLAEKIAYLRDNPAAAANMGKEAYRRYWRSPATLSGHCEELEKVYQSVLETT